MYPNLEEKVTNNNQNYYIPTLIVTNETGLRTQQQNPTAPPLPSPSSTLPLPYQQQCYQQQIGIVSHTVLGDDDAGYTWRQYRNKNRPQYNAITSACMIVSTAGMQLSYLYFTALNCFALSEYSVSNIFVLWFSGIIVGAILSALFARQASKASFNYIGSVLTILSGALQMVHNGTVILSALFLNSVAYGIIIIPLLMHAGEISVKKLRGSMVSNIHMCFTIGLTTGALILTFYMNNPQSKIPLNSIGVIIFGICSFIFNTFMTIESPVYLIDKKRDNEAFELLLKSRNEKHENLQRRHEFNELKDGYLEDISLSCVPFTERNLSPLLLIIILRGIYTVLTSIPVYSKLFSSLARTMSPNLFPLIFLTRLLSEIISSLVIDRKGRKKIMTLSLILTAICLILIGVLNQKHTSGVTLTVIVFLFQFFIALGLGNVSLTYMTEAFPYSKKSSSMLLVIIFEQLIHILMFYIFAMKMYSFDFSILFYIIAAICTIYSFIVCKYVPETSELTLRQCRNSMR